MSSTVHFWV